MRVLNVLIFFVRTRRWLLAAVLLTLTRGLGQGALSVVSIAMIGPWFVRRIDTAMAVYSLALSVGFMLAFPAVGAAIQQWGWRPAWAGLGAALVVVLAPVAMAIVRRSPAAIGVGPDGDEPAGGGGSPGTVEAERRRNGSGRTCGRS